MLRRFFSEFRIKYLNPLQEQDYIELRLPLSKELFNVLLGCLTILFIPLVVRYFLNDFYPQKYIGAAMLLSAIICFLFRNKIQKYIPTIAVMYISIIFGIGIFNTRVIITGKESAEAFYQGYGLALICRLMDFRIAKFHIVFLFNLVFTIFKFAMIATPKPEQIGIILCMELFIVLLAFKSQKADRFLFDSLYKSKNQLLKFKQLLTDYLPNPMLILSSDGSSLHFFNEAYKKLFRSKDANQVKISLDGLILESQSSEENRTLLELLEYEEDNAKPLKLSQIISILAKKLDVIKDLTMLSFQVVEQNTPSFHRSWTSRSVGRRTIREEGSREIDHKVGNLEKANMSHFEKGHNSVNRSEDQGIMDRSHIDTEFKAATKPQRTSLFCQRRQSQAVEEAEHTYEDRDFDSRELRRRVFKVKMFPLTWDNDEAIALVIDDVTHEKTIMELKIADKNKDLVIAMVSHELRTPLNGMLGLLDIMKKEIAQPEILSCLNACKTSGQLLLNLVNSILDFSQIKQKKLKLIYSRVSINDLLTEIKSLFDHFCQIKGLYLDIEIDPCVPQTIITDQTRLSQVIINLLGNAFKFTFKGGVTLRLTHEYDNPHKIIFSVEDTGIGIKKEDQEKLFKLFGRLEQQDRNINAHGVGLGLTISNNLVMMLNPTDRAGIQVESEVGVGTIFSFTVQSEEKNLVVAELDESSCNVIDENELSIPVLERMATYSDMREIQGSHMNSPYKPKSKTVLHHFDSRSSVNFGTQEGNVKNSYTNLGDSFVINNLNISRRVSPFATYKEDCEINRNVDESRPWCLIVDDNPFNLMVAISIVKERGYRTLTALNGQEAIIQVKEHYEKGETLTIILMDCQMPVMDGYEATRILREMMRQGEIGECDIVALTANNRDEQHDKLCESAGMSGILAKPLRIKELEEILQRTQISKESLTVKRTKVLL